MNEKNVGTVDVLKKRFECFQSSKKPVHWLEDRRHEKNVNKRNIKRTPAFRRDVNISRKLVDHLKAPLMVTNNVQFCNSNSNTGEGNKISLTESHSDKAELLNQKSHAESLVENEGKIRGKNNCLNDQKAQLIQCLKKKLENSCAAGCKPKVSKENIEHTLKTPLPVGPPPKKPPRTFAHDKKIDPHISKFTMDCHTSPKSDPKMMLEKLEKFVSEHSHSHEPKNKKTTDLDCNVKKNLKKSYLVDLAKSITYLPSQNICDNSIIKVYDTDEQNYLTTKPFCENYTEHIYDEPIFPTPNSRLNINRVDNRHAPINNEWVGDSDESYLHYMSSPIQNYNTVPNLEEVQSHLKIDTVDELDSGINKNISNERKIQMIMNEAYGTFIKAQEESDSESISNNEDSLNGSKNNLTDKNISEKTLERKGYLRRVSKNLKSTNSSAIQDKKHLFQALLLIGLDLSSTKEKLPYIKYKYPKQAIIPEKIEHLCFPDAHVWPFSADDCRMYSLTVTIENGQRYYGYCYRVQPEGDAYCLPLVYCLYSSIKNNSFYFKILQEIESRHGLSELKMKKFIGLLYNQPFPELGSTIYILQESTSSNTESSTNDGELQRPLDIRQEQDDLLRLLQIIKPSIFIQMLATMLLERKLILLSKSISLLSSCIEGLTASLYPFTWQHTLVSILPSQMVSVADFVQAPTPYIIGLLKTENQSDVFSQLSEHDQVFIFDLDTNKTLRKVKDEFSVIPTRIAKGLKNVIGLKVELDQSTKAVLASESLVRLFVELVGHFRTFVVINSENKQYQFQKQYFIRAGINTAHQNFLEWFTETAMFTSFINNKMHSNNDSKDVFEQRCAEFSLELNKIKRKSKTFPSIKALGDRIKDWAVS